MNKFSIVVTLINFLCAIPLIAFSEDIERNRLIESLGMVNTGMSKDEVNNIMKSYIPGTNFPKMGEAKTLTIAGGSSKIYELEETTDKNGNIALKDCDVFRHCDKCRNDSDWAIVCYKNNLVVWKEFAYD